ncbi:hypothetical protein [Parabacteroides sp. PF5-9]|uniref:hypothetical protein n=1 Tax=Parabacteroides sp. PF5-9 TaxID=1742404 RepID=UPI00247480BD|nr:hypothetical protein [Parabacteroides sp. PF5-9]MDH6357249.1 hypothetical protein [Parabacteroides sp. PF5-9]
MKQTTVLGKVSISPRGKYDEDTPYEWLDCITYMGSSFLVLAPFKGIAPTGDGVITMLLARAGKDFKFEDFTAEQLLKIKGDKGETGKGLTVKAFYPTVAALRAAVPNPEAGDAYGVGFAAPYDIHIYDGDAGDWVNNEKLQGAKGDKGDSAYVDWLNEGHEGDVAAFLDWLRGTDASISVKVDTPTDYRLEIANGEEKVTTPNLKGQNGRDWECPTLDDAPTEETLFFKMDDQNIPFKIGQQARVFDAEEEDYVFHQLYDVTAENKAVWKVAGSGGALKGEKLVVTVESNQPHPDQALVGVKARVSYGDDQKTLTWEGEELMADIPMNMTYKVDVSDVAGYKTPPAEELIALVGNTRNLSFKYYSEYVTINISADDTTSVEGQTVKVENVDTDETIHEGQAGTGIKLRIPHGTKCRVSVNEYAKYTRPEDVEFTAGEQSRTVALIYERILSAFVVVNEDLPDPEYASGDVNIGINAEILSKMRRCLVKKTAEGEVSIAYLKDDDSNYYEDGTPALLNGNEGDVMVYKPEFYYRLEEVENATYGIRTSLLDMGEGFIHSPASLIGAYQSVNVSSKMYSRSGSAPSGSISSDTWETYAKNRGGGYGKIDYEQHCMIMLLFILKYGTRNSQAILGVGGVNYNGANGSTNSLGNRDTEKTTTTHANFQGIEAVHGSAYEWVGGVEINNWVWKITNPDGTIREVQAHNAGGWIKKIAAAPGTPFDVIPTAVGGSETTYYCDYYDTQSGVRVLARSCSSTYTNGGVAYTNASNASSATSAYIASRLAFRGVIRQAQSAEAFKALPVL